MKRQICSPEIRNNLYTNDVFAICLKMNVLRHFKRHHNIETETVARLAVKLMRVAYGEFYNRFCAVIYRCRIVRETIDRF